MESDTEERGEIEARLDTGGEDAPRNGERTDEKRKQQTQKTREKARKREEILKIEFVVASLYLCVSARAYMWSRIDSC